MTRITTLGTVHFLQDGWGGGRGAGGFGGGVTKKNPVLKEGHLKNNKGKRGGHVKYISKFNYS